MPNKPDLPNDLEIHSKHIYGAKKQYLGLNIPEQLKIMDQIYDEIAIIDAKIISIVIVKRELRKEIDLDEWALRLLVERLDSFVKGKQIKNKEYMLMVYDSENNNYNEKRRRMIQEFINNGTYNRCNLNIIESPFFVKSDLRNAIQMVDAISFITRRFIHNCYYPIHAEKPQNKRFHEMFKKIASNHYKAIKKNYKNPQVKGIGLKLFPNISLSKIWDVF